MKATIKWTGDVGFSGTTESGHTILMDGASEAGGRNKGSRPMEVVLIGTGGCTAFDVVHILRKSRQEITDCVAEVEAQRAETDPKVFTHIHIHFIVSGKDLDPKKIQHAIELSAAKYCSASIMLAKTAKITHDFEMIDAK
ncbi:MAG: OsmC family protein [Sulfuricaulis sp.]|uniref:OsmC family protein n=1 Tax=Sulfuricaulis sp. TaxID=2003553 RepID=UPI0034A2EBB3